MNKKPVTDHLGNEYASTAEMCRHYGVKQAAYSRRISQGWSVEDALTKKAVVNIKKAVDPYGNEFASIHDMCKHYGIKQSTYSNRIKKGWRLEDILSIKTHATVYDHNGKGYATIRDMCKTYKITPKIYNERLYAGWSQKDALTKPIKKLVIKDHLGNEYKNVNEMCKNYGISASAYRDRIKKGMSIKDALTKPIRTTKIKDHLGNTYANQIEMTAVYGIDPKLFTARLAKGMSIEDALTLPRNYTARPSTDHLGQTFATFEDLARHYNISAAALLRRLSYMPLEDALTKPKGFRGEYFDHEGNCFRSKTEMCRYWGISINTYDYRIDNGASVEQALSELTDNTRINNDSTVLTKVSTNYYECDIHGNKIILHISKIHELMRANIKDKPNKKRR